jgi:formate hydrogenlyase transcriptional activator
LATGDSINEITLTQDKIREISLVPESSAKSPEENERDYILKVLKISSGKISGEGGAAVILKIPPSTLNFKNKKAGIKKENIFKA